MSNVVKLLDLRSVLARIRSATAESPIIVYGSNQQNLYRTAFGSTILAQKDLSKGRDNYGNSVIGLFDKTTPVAKNRLIIQKGSN
tara:strand:+ start:42 stop:296 length:255 start_codon:yes stop_codon:yes gene_type:complete